MNKIIALPTRLRRLGARFLPSQLNIRPMRGQTMTEYALILAAIAIVVYVTYQTLGTDIGVLVNKVDTVLTSAAS
jgi:Flp pilus assembly pilin Flp